MTTYKDIRGTHITTVTTDPPAPVNGQMWYNSTTQVMKGFTSSPVGSWSTAGSLNTGRYAKPGATGTATAGLYFGGFVPTTPYYKALNESYNGTSWTEVADMNTARSQMGSAGQAPYTAALGFGGQADPGYKTETESWNGSSWTEVADMNTARDDHAGAGIQTAALGFGGAVPSGKSETESWNGSSWTEVNDLNSARGYLGGSGTYTAALAFGGQPSTGKTENWNGSSWTEVADLNSGRQYLGDNGGTNTDSITSGGYTSTYVANTELWNGTAWTETTDMSSARGWGASLGTSSSLLYMGGTPPEATTATEEWTAPSTSTVTFTAS